MLSHMVVKLKTGGKNALDCLRVVLSHMVVKHQSGYPLLLLPFESSVISYGSQTPTWQLESMLSV